MKTRAPGMRRCVKRSNGCSKTMGQLFSSLRAHDSTHAAHDMAERARTLSPGELVVGRFRIVTLLGAGGMGEVYEAEDLLLKQ